MFEFKKDYILKNNVVEISPLTEEHIEPLYKESLSENIWKYFLENGTGKENFVNYILSAI
ncbi:hypothetical protein OO010_12010 [Flavobacteriaceae bacterium KMM 6898]|nr:hypothetical protein [Flavobacteriaceae bacterium KMM 6898]